MGPGGSLVEMPRTGSRGLVLLALFAVLAVAVAALARPSEPPRLDPPAPPSDVRVDQPSSGRLLAESEVREQLGVEWRDASLSLVRFGEVADLEPTTDWIVSRERLVWLCVRRDGQAWMLRVYDAASGVRFMTLAGSGAPPR